MKKFLSTIIVLALVAACAWHLWNEYQDAKADYAPIDQAQIEQIYQIQDLPDYSGEPVVVINGGIPDFAPVVGEAKFFERYSKLDDLGRCGPAEACLDRWHMPEGERGEIESVRPSGWKPAKYDFIDNEGFLYNRCHMIGWQLTGRDADWRNLITGTRYMNVDGMLPYENKVAHYLRRSYNHVQYRVTPIFQGKELVCRGVQMEARSVEDNGEGVCFNVFCYNVQPYVEINYLTGESRLTEDAPEVTPEQPTDPSDNQ